MHEGAISTPAIRNRLLSVVPPEELDILLLPKLEQVSLPVGTVIAHAGDSLRHCFFPENGMISLLSVTENGNTCEAGYTGFEGIIGMPVFFGKNEMPYQALVQAPSDGFRIEADVVLSLFRRNGVFHDAVLRFAYVIVRQMTQTCVCNHFHPIRSRLCRWLSVMCERSGNRRLSVTQEFLSRMLGVQRTSIGMITHAMQADGMIRYSRGRLEVIDLEKLNASACECLTIIRNEYRDFLDDKNFSAMSTSRQTQASV